jgi:nitrite reductase (NADH) small subunit
MNTPQEAIMAASASWFTLGPAWMIPPGEGRVFRVDGRDVAVFRTRAGAVFATQPLCPHRHGPLADGIVGGATVVCPLHAMTFDLATGAAIGHGCGALITYRVQLSTTDEILLSLCTQTPSAAAGSMS